MPADRIPLDEEGSAKLRALLRFLRFECKIKYTDLAEDIKIDVADIFDINSRRSVGDIHVFNKIIEFCNRKGIDWRKSELTRGGDVYSISRYLGIDGNINESIEGCYGKYLMFSYYHGNDIAVTWFSLNKKLRGVSMPTFTAWRRDQDGNSFTYKGFYYSAGGTLFVFGHTSKTSFSRTLSLISYPGGHRYDRFGIISGASLGDKLFMSICYFKFISRTAKRREYLNNIGDHGLDVIENTFPEIAEFLVKKQALQLSISRPLG